MSARNPSSLSGLPDPWHEHSDGVGSLDFVWRMFRLAAADEAGEVRNVGRSMKDRTTNERIELEALKLAHLRSAANGTTVEAEFIRVVDAALQRFAEEVRESRGRVPWNLGYFATGWGRCARGLEPKEHAA